MVNFKNTIFRQGIRYSLTLGASLKETIYVMTPPPPRHRGTTHYVAANLILRHRALRANAFQLYVRLHNMVPYAQRLIIQAPCESKSNCSVRTLS